MLRFDIAPVCANAYRLQATMSFVIAAIYLFTPYKWVSLLLAFGGLLRGLHRARLELQRAQGLHPREDAAGQQQRFLLYRFHVKDPVYFSKSFKMTMDNLGWTGPRYDDYTSVAFWYQQKPGKLPFELPADAEMVMK